MFPFVFEYCLIGIKNWTYTIIYAKDIYYMILNFQVTSNDLQTHNARFCGEWHECFLKVLFEQMVVQSLFL